MKILLAVDQSLYSRYAAREAVELAFNSRAEVTIMGLADANGGQDAAGPVPLDGRLGELMASYRDLFLQHGPADENPYIPRQAAHEWLQVAPGAWEELTVLRGAQKRLRTMVRRGSIGQILDEDAADDYDLIVLGCGPAGVSLGGASVGPLMKLVEDARASVLLVKQDQAIAKIVCCLDRWEVPHSSLEMINQMATIHGASLELLGITREGWLRMEVDSKLSGLWSYFDSSQDKVVAGFKEHSELQAFVSNEARPDLLVLWRGEKSLLNRLFPKKWLGELVGKSQSSVLILR